MAEKLLDCVVVSSDATLVARAARLMEDRQRGLQLVAQYTSPIAEISKAQAEEMRQSGAQVLLLDLGGDPAIGLRLARFLAEENPSRTFVLTGPVVEPDVLLEAMRVGVSEYLPQPIEEADLAAALARATRRLGISERREPVAHGRVIALYGAKGGSGVTTAAANLGVTLAQKKTGTTLLLDLDLDMGGTALLLGLRPRYSVIDVVRNLHRLDRELLDSYVERHDSGLHVLASPAHIAANEPITREQTRAMLQVLRRHYENVVVDLDRAITPLTLAAVESADSVLVLTTPDVAALNNTKRALPLIDRAAGDTRRIHIVVNRSRANDLISASDIRTALGRDVYASLAEDDTAAAECLNTGKPIALRRKSKYSRALRQLATLVDSPAAANGKSASSNGKGASPNGNGAGKGLLMRFRRNGKH